MPITRPFSGAKKRVLGMKARALHGRKRCRSKEKMADAEDGGVESEVIRIAESTTPITKASPAQSTTGTASAAGTVITAKHGTKVAAPNIESDLTQLS